MWPADTNIKGQIFYLLFVAMLSKTVSEVSVAIFWLVSWVSTWLHLQLLNLSWFLISTLTHWPFCQFQNLANIHLESYFHAEVSHILLQSRRWLTKSCLWVQHLLTPPHIQIMWTITNYSDAWNKRKETRAWSSQSS